MPRRTSRRFTASIIRSLPPGEHSDAACPGLYVRVTPQGSRSYVYRYTSPLTRKSLRKTLAPCDALTLAQARDLAKEYAARVAAGEDPVEADKRRRSEMRVSTLVETYIRERDIKESTRESYRCLLRNHIGPRIGDRAISTVTRADVEDFFKKVSEKTESRAALAVKLLKMVFNFALDRGLLPESHPNPAQRVTVPPTRERVRYFSADERRRFHAALEHRRATSEAHKPVYDAIRLLEMTGARRREITSMLWSEVDLEAGKIRKVEHKSSKKKGKSKTRTIYLSGPALKVMRRLHANRKDSISWVFPSAKDPGRPMDRIEDEFKMILEVAGIEGFCIHCLRHSFAADALGRGITLGTLAKLLGHSTIVVTQRYAHLCDAAARDAVDVIAEAMSHLDDDEDNVIALNFEKSKTS